jgi:hypothetical protein
MTRCGVEQPFWDGNRRNRPTVQKKISEYVIVGMSRTDTGANHNAGTLTKPR